MRAKDRFTTIGYVLALGLLLVASVEAKQVLTVHVDATELPRKLLRSRIEVDVDADTLVFLYPKWIPGIHAPKGPIENVAGFVPRDAQGQVLAWERDGTDMFRFLVPRQEAAEGPTTVELTYITNQPSTNSRGVDAFGYRTLGIINWNTVLLYLEGLKIVGIDDRVFTRERLQAAVKASKQTGQIELLTLDAQQYVTYTLAYAGGHQYLHTVPVEGRVDRLEQIVAPRRPGLDEASDHQ